MGVLSRRGLVATAFLLCLQLNGLYADIYVRVMANETAVLACWNLGATSTVELWLTPENVPIARDDATLSGKYFIDTFSGALSVQNTLKKDSGYYKCISKQTDGKRDVAKVELHVVDVSYIKELDDWQANLVRGIIVAACTMVFFVVSCGLKEYSWHERNHKRELTRNEGASPEPTSSRTSDPSTLSEMSISNMKGTDNPAMMHDDEIDSGL